MWLKSIEFDVLQILGYINRLLLLLVVELLLLLLLLLLKQ